MATVNGDAEIDPLMRHQTVTPALVFRGRRLSLLESYLFPNSHAFYFDSHPERTSLHY